MVVVLWWLTNKTYLIPHNINGIYTIVFGGEYITLWLLYWAISTANGLKLSATNVFDLSWIKLFSSFSSTYKPFDSIPVSLGCVLRQSFMLLHTLHHNDEIIDTTTIKKTQELNSPINEVISIKHLMVIFSLILVSLKYYQGIIKEAGHFLFLIVLVRSTIFLPVCFCQWYQK